VASSLLILGGARSGKSRFAVSGLSARARVTVVVTAEARDADMAARIARHRAERPARWTTVEAPVDLVPRVADALGAADTVIVDCLTLWVSNRQLRGDGDEAILKEADALAALVAAPAAELRIVSNEVGLGVHPATADGLRFRDLLGCVNQRVAAAAHRVALMVAGLPHLVKDAPAASGVDARAPEAP
jgi:adenosylcobinamide kinase / adenosylcobinamide-phosphate guanylyltransferase